MRIARGSLILICIGLIASASAAQAGGMLGLRLGTAISNVSGDVSSSVDMATRNGFTATGFLQMGDGMLSVQPELGYVQKGAKDNITSTKIELDYAEVAGLLKVHVPVVPIQSHVFGGVGADFNVQTVAPAGFDANNLDWNAIFGGDVMMNAMGLNVVGDGRYAMGLNSVTSGSSAVADIKNRAWAFSAGLGIKF